MTRTFYDLSDCLSNSTSSFEFNKHEITYVEPEITALITVRTNRPDRLDIFRRALEYTQDPELQQCKLGDRWGQAHRRT